MQQPRQRAVADGLARVAKGGPWQLAVGDAAERLGRHQLELVEGLLPQQHRGHQVGRVMLPVEAHQRLAHVGPCLGGPLDERALVAPAEAVVHVALVGKVPEQLRRACRVALLRLLELRLNGLDLALGGVPFEEGCLGHIGLQPESHRVAAWVT